MLLRSDARGTLLIGQPAHAWISGQLARAWGNEAFGGLDPREPVCLAAEQHDIGMADWDLEAARNPSTGLPRSFMEMPIGAHLEMWRAGPRRLLRQSRYAALLTSMHGVRLYEMRDLNQLDAPDAAAVRAYLTEQRAFQAHLLTTLRDDPAISAAATPECIARNSDLIWTWDYLSLAICLDWAPCTAHAVPISKGATDVGLSPTADLSALTLEPWPFTEPAVVVRCEGQRLSGRCETDEQLRQALATAAWETLSFELTCQPRP